jgi:hypothetical protein
VVTSNDLLPRLQKHLKNALIRAKLLGTTVNELTNNAQTMWRTFEHRESKEPLQKPGARSQDASNNRAAGGRSRPPARPTAPDTPGSVTRDRDRLSTEEKERRKKTGACFNCGLIGHVSRDCRRDFYPHARRFDGHNRQNNKRPASDAEPEDQPPRQRAKTIRESL